MKLYLVRHGKTDWNVLGKMQGCTDIPLNKVGEKQAQLIKAQIKEQIDISISSPLKRAVQTAQIITESEPIIDERLIERKMGNFEGKAAYLYDSKKYWDYKSNYGDNGVEKVQDLFERVTDFLKDIKEKYKDKTVLVVSHGATIRALHFAIASFSENENFLALDVPNCGIFKYEL